MRTAVILSTYNAPDRLQPALIGYLAQRRTDFELIVADDGSTEATRDLIDSLASQYCRPIRHVWQPDVGFRKCRILNQAVLSTKADYLIFSDGDCIPRPDFVDAHLTRARLNHFLSGGYFKLTEKTSAQLTPESILAGLATDADWLLAHGTPRSSKLGKLRARGWHAELMNVLTPTRPTWNGHNSSCWRSDLLHINGFDERMEYWAQDREFGERLVNSGISGLQVRYSAICVHVHHERPYKTAVSRERNRQIRAETKALRATWTQHGIMKSARNADDAVEVRMARDVTAQSYGTGQRAAA